MKPMIILPPGTMSKEDMQQLRDNGICVVEAAHPEKVTFVDPIIPTSSSRTQMEDAAIKLSRKLLRGELVGVDYRKNVAALYVDILVEGTPLDPNYRSPKQIEQDIYNSAKADELRRLAREEAKAERATAKAQAAKK